MMFEIGNKSFINKNYNFTGYHKPLIFFIMKAFLSNETIIITIQS